MVAPAGSLSDAHVAVSHDFLHVDDDLGAEGFRFGGGGFDVVDTDVGQPHGGSAGHGVLHHSADGIVAVLDEGVVHRHAGDVFKLPVEEFGVEGFGAGYVGWC